MMKVFFLNLALFLFSQFGLSQCYNLVWADEFSGTSIDATKWTHETGGDGWGNNELQHYTDRPENSFVSGGSLKIIALSETYSGNNYTSAKLNSSNKGDWTYGKMEASIKFPEGQGIWPAFWMMPTNSVYGTWPASGEIDIMEYLGHQTSVTHGTCHYGNAWNDKSSSGTANDINPLSYDDGAFHTFSIEWDPNQIRWYADGLLFHTFNVGNQAPYTYPFNKDFYLILNLAVGGNWPGPPDGSTTFPQTLEVDYVRVYQEIQDIEILGEKNIEPNETGILYSVPNLSGATYIWTVPAGVTIVSGAGTNEIEVNWGANSDSISVEITNACGTATTSSLINTTTNTALNPGFELDLLYWINDIFDGAAASFLINQTDVHGGDKALCVEVTNLGTATWNIQSSPQKVPVINGEDYIVSFWAKSDVPGRVMSMAIINSVDFSYYGGQTYTLTDTWDFYSYSYTSTVNADVSINLEFGHELGTFCIDDYFMGKAPLLSLDLVSFKGNWQQEKLLLSWETKSENNFSHFEIERASNGIDFENIGKVNGKNLQTVSQYYFLDKNPNLENYYRLKIIKEDETYEYSNIIFLNKKIKKGLSYYPSPIKNKLYIEGLNSVSKIYLFDTLGIRIKEFNTKNKNDINLDLSELNTGIYFIKIGKQTIKVFKE